MNNTIAIVTEIIILIFNILIFMELTLLKKDTKGTKAIMYIGSALMLCAYFVCTFYLKTAEAISSFVCITIPSVVLFWSLSKYKDMRFFATFCFLDTMTLILTFITRATEIYFGKTVGIIGYVFICVFMLVVYLKGKPYFKRYREILDVVPDGWGAMAVSTFLIYILLVFTASYPKPMIERQEYILPYFILSVTLLSFYFVFISSVLQKKKLYELNLELQHEQKWHRIAYVDSLTEMANRMAYTKKINELERQRKGEKEIFALMLDLDNFKKINDTLGHHIGDITLKKAADCLKKTFSEDNFELFRIGGDEFAVISQGLSKEELELKLSGILNDEYIEEVGCSFSVGYSKVRDENNSLENAFIRADNAMYKMKAEKKK